MHFLAQTHRIWSSVSVQDDTAPARFGQCRSVFKAMIFVACVTCQAIQYPQVRSAFFNSPSVLTQRLVSRSHAYSHWGCFAETPSKGFRVHVLISRTRGRPMVPFSQGYPPLLRISDLIHKDPILKNHDNEVHLNLAVLGIFFRRPGLFLLIHLWKPPNVSTY